MPSDGRQIEVRRFNRKLEGEWFSPDPIEIEEYIKQEK